MSGKFRIFIVERERNTNLINPNTMTKDLINIIDNNIQYLKGNKLDADFFTKPQPPIKQKHFSSRLVVPTA